VIAIEIIRDPSRKKEYIRRFGLDEHLPDEVVRALDLCLYHKGEYLLFQEEELRKLFMLVEGKLQVDYIETSGKQVVYSFETPFSMIGDMELMDDQSVVANVQALQDSLVFTAPVSLIREKCLDQIPFLKFLLRYLNKKLYFSCTLLTQYALSAENRLARYLLYRSRLDGRVITLENRESLASILGISVRHINRTLKSLSRQGAIRLRNKELTILDLDKLTELIQKGT
jgi:CRP/FNR family transcriptional regulator, putaive post-exponential-phase nitrogen-starvation regulator